MNFSSFKVCAHEGGTFNMSETGYKLVRYGYDPRYTYKILNSNSVSCSNTVFGDPFYGRRKICDYIVTDDEMSP